ncbi:hypothetical protein H4582DRAFT_2124837 [Lactarius indigo]|nr:hypothetical protein H4582DRAFT_2124837 [Lactarius indigo]
MGAVGATVDVVLAPVVATAVLNAVGLCAIGPVAGSAATAIQAGIGNVAAGSLFATAQSVAMGGSHPRSHYSHRGGLGRLVRCSLRRYAPCATEKVAGVWRRFSSWFKKRKCKFDNTRPY